MWGPDAHRKWHYIRDGQPPFFVRWFIRFRLWGMYNVSLDLWTRLVCMLTCTEMPWHVEAREAAEEEEEEEEEEEKARETKKLRGDASPDTAENAIFANWEELSEEGSDAEGEEEEEEEVDEETAEDVRFKRNVVAMGFAAVYVSWVRHPLRRRVRCAAAL